MQRGGPFWGKGGKCVVFNRLGREVLSEEFAFKHSLKEVRE